MFCFFSSLGAQTSESEKPKIEKVKTEKEVKMTIEEEQQRSQVQKSREEPRISNKWFKGNYLIYDCDKGFFACVNSVSNTQCIEQRATRIEDRSPALGCAPLKRFSTQEDCFKVQYEKMHNQTAKVFCLHPNFR